MLVETATNMLKLNLIGRPNFAFGQLNVIMDFYDFFFFSATYAFFGLWTPVSLVFWWRNMTVYSSPYKVGLIYAGTKFAQSWLVRSEIAKSANWISS